MKQLVLLLDSSGELSLNSSDAGTETFDRDVALSMVANEQEALNETKMQLIARWFFWDSGN